MNPSKRAWLALESGEVYEGRSIGAAGEKGGELVFNTAMTGYQEIPDRPLLRGAGGKHDLPDDRELRHL